jgi:hypothetical protein
MLRQESRKILLIAASAALTVLAASAFAFPIDPRVIIEKALEQNSIIVRFADARAATVELRLDGKVIASRDVASSQRAGEVTFDLDQRAFDAGEHKLEVVLFTSGGTRLASGMSKLSVSARDAAPVLLRMPKFGEQIAGEYQVDIAIDSRVRQPYVSLFIDRQFREMRNNPPYRFAWDTTKEALGWHTVEAWAYDLTGSTYKSPQIQVYVNNPGGRTERIDPHVTEQAGLISVPGDTDVVGDPAGAKGFVSETSTADRNPRFSAPGAVTSISQGLLSTALIATPISEAASTKAVDLYQTRMTGQRLAVPGPATEIAVSDTTVAKATAPKATVKTVQPALSGSRQNVPLAGGTRQIASAKVGATASLNVRTAPALVTVGVGTRLSVNQFSLYFDGKPVSFDVQPRTIEGIAVAPFRHLFEYAGGKVKWDNQAKTLSATRTGTLIQLVIGNALAMLNGSEVQMDHAAFLEKGRTIVPLSFMGSALNVDVDYDPTTGHVLLTSKE